MDNTKVRVENVTKVFRKHPQRALSLLKRRKKQIGNFERDRNERWCEKATFEVYSGEIFRYYGFVR